jgi:hypothetical protein
MNAEVLQSAVNPQYIIQLTIITTSYIFSRLGVVTLPPLNKKTRTVP